ncbi:unnamed protein product [Mytilus coruscus]|uniref:Integrase zinc-binding domain-containing protein n=1 Tax=Mytilus coruscus TaxID=42192 RepID=A0A6J8BSR5_MYTCO|nr:unnamed protein product [Mytilus coruscus]
MGWKIISNYWVPANLKEEVLKNMHASVLSGHLGRKKTKGKLSRNYFRFEMKEDVNLWISRCNLCGANKPPPKHAKAHLGNMLVGEPLDRLATDLIGPFPVTPRGMKYNLTVSDYFTKWVFAVPDQGAITCAQVILNEMSHYMDLASKRGLAYRCMKCLPPSRYTGEKSRVEAHIWKHHIPLNESPFFCSQCLFRATREGAIRRYVMTFPSHLLQKNKLMASNKFIEDEYYLKKSSNPYHLTLLDLVPMTHQESHDFWSTKRRRVEQPKGLQSGSVSLSPVHLAPFPVAPAQTLHPLLSSSTLSNYSWVNSSTASHTASSVAPIATSSSMIPQMTISPESFSQYLPVDLTDFSTGPYSLSCPHPQEL